MNRKEIFAKIIENMGVLHRFGAGHKVSNSHQKMPTRSQICFMAMLAHEDSKTIKELAKQFSMSSSAATQIVDGLVKEKILLRQIDKKDRRKINISLTDLGKKKLLLAKKLRIKIMSKYFEALTDQELAPITENFRKNCRTF
jgi:DNA-binding MarR family transcriptional regulator